MDEKQKEQAKLRKRKQRDKERDINSVTLDSVTQYPAIVHALADPDKRRKLEKITQSLQDFKQEKNVYYGYPDKGLSFDIVGELLEVTK